MGRFFVHAVSAGRGLWDIPGNAPYKNPYRAQTAGDDFLNETFPAKTDDDSIEILIDL
jgi:hypothetical protein